MTIYLLLRHSQDILRMSSRLPEDVLKTQEVFKTSCKMRNCASWKARNCYAEDDFKTSSRRVF